MVAPDDPAYSIADSKLTYELYLLNEKSMVEFNGNCGDGNPMLYHWVGSGENCRGMTEKKEVWAIRAGGQTPVATSSDVNTFDSSNGRFTF